MPGLCAAGDVVSALDQRVVAAGEGAIAAAAIHAGLRRRDAEAGRRAVPRGGAGAWRPRGGLRQRSRPGFPGAPVAGTMRSPHTPHRIQMSTSYRELTSSISASLATLRADIPDTTRGFSSLAMAATRSGTLDKKTKELIAMALSVGARCDPCVGFHAKALVELGCTRAEFEEMLGVCVYMGGGPSLMYAAKALHAWDEFGGEAPARAA